MAYATLEQIAHLLKLTPRMVNLHVKERGMPRVGRGEYDLVKCVHWYLDFKDRQIEAVRKGDETEQQARGRLTIASADLRELELSSARGEVIEVESIRLLWERIVVAFKTKMLSLPTKLPQRLIVCKEVNQIKELLDQEITEALNELSNTHIDVSELRRLAKSRHIDDEIGEAPSKTHGEPVGRQKQDIEPRVKRRTRPVEDRQS